MRSLALVTLFLAGSAVAHPGHDGGQSKLDKILAGRTQEEQVSCIPRRSNTHIEAVDGALVYRDSFNKRLWVNRPAGGCDLAHHDPIFVSTSPIGQVCRGDIVRLVDRTSRIEYGACNLGDFTPYVKGPPHR